VSVAEPAARLKGVCWPPSLPLPAARADRLAGVLKALADPIRLQIDRLRPDIEPRLRELLRLLR
jgi:hypothetical protein